MTGPYSQAIGIQLSFPQLGSYFQIRKISEDFSPISSMIPKILLLIKQIGPTTPQINNLRTPIPIFLQPRAFVTVECI